MNKKKLRRRVKGQMRTIIWQANRIHELMLELETPPTFEEGRVILGPTGRASVISFPVLSGTPPTRIDLPGLGYDVTARDLDA